MIAGIGETVILSPVDVANEAFVCMPGNDMTGVITGAVIDDDELHRHVGIHIKKACHQAIQQRCGIQCENDDGYSAGSR